MYKNSLIVFFLLLVNFVYFNQAQAEDLTCPKLEETYSCTGEGTKKVCQWNNAFIFTNVGWEVEAKDHPLEIGSPPTSITVKKGYHGIGDMYNINYRAYSAIICEYQASQSTLVLSRQMFRQGCPSMDKIEGICVVIPRNWSGLSRATFKGQEYGFQICKSQNPIDCQCYMG